MAGHKDRRKDRAVAKAGKPILAGSIYRESLELPGVMKKRQAVLFRDKFGTYSKKSSSKADNNPKKKRLDKVWVFGPSHSVSPIKRRKLNVLEKERKRPLLSLAPGHHVERELYTFTLKSESRRGKAARLVEDNVDLAFEDLEEAMKWRQAIDAQVAAARRQASPSAEVDTSRDARRALPGGIGCQEALASTASDDDSDAVTFYTTSGDLSEEASALASRNANDAVPVGASDNASDATPEDGSGRASNDTPEAADLPTPPESEPDAFDRQMIERASSLEVLQRELRLGSRSSGGSSLEDWKILCSDNGITVLRGTGANNADSVMLSYIVRAPPRLCVKTLLKGDHQSIQVDSLNFKAEVVETVDEFNDVLHTTWHPQGLLSRFLIAPREIDVRRLWRREDDGSYVVLFKATDQQPDKEVAERPWWDWFKQIPCKMVDSGYTFSPLTPEYANNGESCETLVTHVACLGDMGGWMSHGHPVEQLLRIFGASSARLSSFLRPLINHNIALRNKAESERFSVRPYLQSHAVVGPQQPVAPLTVAKEAPGIKASPSPLGCPAPDTPPAEIKPPVSVFKEPARSKDPPSSGHPSGLSSVPESALHEQTNGNGTHKVGPCELEMYEPTPGEAATCDPKYWSCPGSNGLKVRGANYLKDKKKILAEEPRFTLAATDLLWVDTPTLHVARFLPSLRASRAPFTFIVQIMFGSPSLSLTFSWASPCEEDGNSLANSLSSLPSGTSSSGTDGGPSSYEQELLGRPFELTLARFLAGGDDMETNQRRNGTVKLIPRISQGSWFVKQSVGTTPCLLGRKLTTRYFRGPNYIEMDVDVSSSSVAASVVGLVQGYTKSLVVDMAIVLEGKVPEELPESLLGTVRCAHLDLHSAKYLNTETGEIVDVSPPKSGHCGRKPAAADMHANMEGVANLHTFSTTGNVQDTPRRAQVYPNKSI